MRASFLASFFDGPPPPPPSPSALGFLSFLDEPWPGATYAAPVAARNSALAALSSPTRPMISSLDALASLSSRIASPMATMLATMASDSTLAAMVWVVGLKVLVSSWPGWAR